MDFGFSSLNSDMGSNEDYDLEYLDPDACLNPVDRLEKYVESEHTYSRQLAARSLLETFQQLDGFSDAERVLKVLFTLANDPDGVVRTELCEQLAHIGNVCIENRATFTSGDTSYDPLANDILPIIFRYMTDPNNQVRKTSQTALADLVEQKLVTSEDVVSKVSPIISRLADLDSSEDYRSEAASLLCRLAPIVGAELTGQLFLDHFQNLCADHIFQIRKICAVNFGSMCQVVGREKTESLLLERFFSLCTDGIWGVRKACTECFMQVSLVCSSAVRHSHLSAVFINLVADQSRWVRMAAFEALGGFISTFADPSATGLHITDDGTLVSSGPPSVPLDEKRRNGDVKGEFDERLSVLKEDLVATANNTTNPTIERETNLINIGVFSVVDSVQVTADDRKTTLGCCCEPSGGDAAAVPVSCISQAASSLSDNDVGALHSLAHSQGCEIATVNQNNCDAGHSHAVELEQVVAIVNMQEPAENGTEGAPENGTEGPLEHGTEGAQNTLENGVCESTISDDIVENCAEEGVRWSLADVENQNVDIAGNNFENILKDEKKSLKNNQISSAEDLNAETICHRNEIPNGRSDDVTVDTIALDICLENNAVHAAVAADKMVQQFGCLDFWQQMVPELGETSLPKDVCGGDVVTERSEDNSLTLTLNSETMTPGAQNLNSKLLDSVSHLSNSTAATDPEVYEANHEPLEAESGGVEPLIQAENGIQEVRNVKTAESQMMEDSRSDVKEDPSFLDGSKESDESTSEAPMECDDLDDSKDIVATENQSSNLINELETEEIPLYDDFPGEMCEMRNDAYKPMLQLLDDMSDSDNSTMDICEVDLENGVEVDDEEIRELVAAAKDMPCDDVTIYHQDIVPSDLLQQYLSMMDPSCAQKVDSEITRHCAYSLPAVAFTLGRKNWPSLKTLYTALAADVQWKVRRTLAFSIHDLAMIVGEEITSRDLVPVFDGFLNDLDEVRIGVLKHLADFLRLLPVDARRGYLLKIAELLKTDNSRNWRFREELARQLFMLLDLFTVADIQEHISPIALRLVDDHVAQVRLAAVQVLGHILKQLVGHEERSDGHRAWTSYLSLLKDQFAESSRSTKRQMYVQLCNCVLQDRVIGEECFAEKFLPTLLSLRHDAIPNVRLTLARTIAQHIKHSEYFSSPKNPYLEELAETVHSLEDDRDRDVRLLISDVKPCDDVEHSSAETAAL